MTRDLLLEIGTEEIPARFVDEAVKQLAERIERWLVEANIGFESIVTYTTPRRLAVVIKGVEETQQDRVEEVRGPSVKAAKDEQGEWSKAAMGFLKGQGMAVEDLYIQTVKDVEYIFVKKEYKGQEVEGLLPAALKDIVLAMTFPKNMRWGSQELRYVRPIRWMIALFGDKIMNMEVAGVEASNVTRGHRFLGKEITISSASEYEEKLSQQFVIVDSNKRRKIILEQIKELETLNNWHVPIKEDLLTEVTNLIEYPTVLFGSFKEEFLEVPSEVLVTTMREHQRYFPVEDLNGHLLPYFITVRNGNNQSLDVVRKGNEKVLTARLADARFFYLEDQKREISESVSKLESVVFQEGLGTIGDKVRRVKEVSLAIAEILSLDEGTNQLLSRTAEICKFDLVTNMVYEFPELQGLMGEKYARILGEEGRVAKGIFEHYLPRFSGDLLPEDIIGQVLSMADKLDNIVGSFSLGKIPTGSQDPLGLRRQAAGIVQILLEKIDGVGLKDIFSLTIETYAKRGLLKHSKDEILGELYDFFTLRLKALLQDYNIRYDVIDAILETDKSNIKLMVQKANILSKELQQPAFKGIVDSFTRVMNIANKATSSETNPTLYIEEEEKNLYQAFISAKTNASKINDMEQIMGLLKELKDPIDFYFEKVMVMVENDELRQQRLGLMKGISNFIKEYADFSKLVFA